MASQISLASPAVEQHPTGFGVGTATPRLSWRFLAPKGCPRDWQQTAYEIQVTRVLNSYPETYSVKSDNSVLVPWPSTPLKSRESARVRVRAFGRGDGQSEVEPTDWSPWTVVECALLSRDDWSALPITELTERVVDGPLRPVRFRKSFNLTGKGAIERARLYITSLGVYRAFINGREVSDHCLAPGWTSYRYRLNYQTLDVAPFLNQDGENTIAIEVAEGWYATRLGFKGGRRKIYGDKIAAIAQLEIQLESGRFSLVTDRTWICQPSAILKSEFYDGETYDAREEDPNWKQNALDTSNWNSVDELPLSNATLIAPDAPPVRVTEEIKPISVQSTPSGKTILDFGQNLVGRLRVHSVNKPSGTRLVFTHAEVLEHGELGTRPLRIAKCTDEIICSGAHLTDWSPQYTFHGFRYVQVVGWDEKRDGSLLANVTAQVLHTDMTRTGWFSCSHSMINKLHGNALWSMRGNFVSIPTDCPQRDERLGWTGDIQIFGSSANFLYNTAGMLGEWLQDVAAEQFNEGKDGCVPPFVVPNAEWDDVVILGPWSLYKSYGDVDILRRQYPSMLAWIDRGIQRGSDGDWLDPTAPPVEPDAFLVHITFVISQISDVLGETADSARFTKDLARLKATFQEKYIAQSGLLVGDSQTALSLAIAFDLHATWKQKEAAATRLVDLVRLAQFRVATGFAGTPIITHALTKGGHPQMAYRMLLEKRCPSWMYPITMGATTMWERWDSMLPDGSINPGEMTSFNHYAFGSIINWLHTTVAGVSPLSPGWREIRVRPIPGGDLESAEVAYETPYGRLECKWRIQPSENIFTLELLVPPNSRALVNLPSQTQLTVQQEEQGAWVGSGRSRKKQCTSCSNTRWKCDLADDSPRHPESDRVTGRIPLPRPLVDLYFDLIDEKQLLLFHRTTFITAHRASRVPEFTVPGMTALMARFSPNPYFGDVHSWNRAQHILLSSVALAEGDAAQEALLTAQAICMVQMLHLPERLSVDPIQREVEIRLFWGMWMIENWQAARALVPKQLTASPDYQRPLEEQTYKNMKPYDKPDQYSETRIAAIGPRTVAWGPGCFHWLGREFTILQLNFHHQCQMLYHQFVNKKRPQQRAALTMKLDTDENSIATAKKLLEQTFIMLLQFRKYWSLVELSMARLRAFYRVCQKNFLNRYDAHVSERYSDGVYDSISRNLNTDTPPSDLWLGL
ncbi:bacterial alpha-L-rhamnosidase-domain-containing protein [Aspergillus undulatus]|uniref:bacterial alpha-L-rhamnosidase-domain-containing protein n=1 Tax=Aspergillus undulatus TaxID=1810928 RepID=UPI003CCD8D6F